MKLAVLAALIAIALPAPASASDWALVMRTAGNDRWYVNRQSIQTMSNGHKAAWIWVYFGKINNTGTRMRFLFEFNCSLRAFRDLNTELFYGKNLTGRDDAPGNWQYTPPASKSPLINFVCDGKR